MARFNKAKNFAGKSYVVSDEVDSLIKSLKTSPNTDYTLVFEGVKMDDGTIGSHTLDLTAWFKKVTAEITGQALGIEQGKGISFTQSSSSTSEGTKDITVIHADVDGTTIGFTTDDASGKIKSLLTIKKLDTATTGYAASYQLQDVNGNLIGEVINIAKDQFLKGAEIIEGGMINGEFKTKSEIEELPEVERVEIEKFIHFTFEINKKDADGKVTTEENNVYLNVHELVDVYTAGNTAISISTDNKISGVVNSTDKIYTSKGNAISVLSINDGIKVSGIQEAIDLAVDNLKAKTQAALTDMSSDVETFETNINGALSDMASKVNGAIDTVESNIGKAITSVNTALTNTVDSVNTKIGNDIEAINDAVSTAITGVDNKVDDAVSAVNTKVGAAIGSVNTQVKAAVTAINGEIDDAVGAVNTALGTTVTNVNTNVKTAFNNVFQMVEETSVEMEQVVTVDGEGKNVVLPVVKEITGRVLAVYDAEGYQIYPEIKYTGGKTMIIADFGVRKEEQEGEEVIVPYSETWTVLKTAAVTFTDATAGSATFTADVDFTDAEYENIAAIDDVAYAAPAEATDATAGSATFSGVANDITAQNVEADVAAEIATLDYKQA